MKGQLPLILVVVLIGALMLSGIQDAAIKMSLLGGSGGSSGTNPYLSNGGDGNKGGKREDGTLGSTDGVMYDPTASFGTGEGFDFLKLLEWAKSGNATTQDQIYYLDLLNAYHEVSQNKFNTMEYQAPPSYFAGMHKNETGRGFFTKDVIGKDSSIVGKVTILNTDESVVAEQISGYRSKTKADGSVWYDAKGDGWPDGPFQAENGTPSTHQSFISTDSKKSTYDPYSFRDNSNAAISNYNSAVAGLMKYNIALNDTQKNMYGAVNHNRGSQINQAHGIGYRPSGNPRATDYINYGEDSETSVKQETEIVKTLYNSWIKNNLEYPKDTSENSAFQALAWLMLIKEGWMLEEPVHSSFQTGINYLFNDSSNSVRNLFPEIKTAGEMITEINTNHVKPFYEAMGISASEADRRYGTISGQYIQGVINAQGKRGSYAFIYKNEGNPNPDMYKIPETTQVRAYDFVSCGYFIQIGLVGENALIELAILAGASEQMDGKVIDPTNPSTFYNSLGKSYNPASGNDGESVKQILSMLGISASQRQYDTILEVYKECGALYSQGGGGGTRWWWKGGKSDGRRKLDCSSLASVGASLGNFTSEGGPNYYCSSRDWGAAIGSTRSVQYGGAAADVTLVQIDKSGVAMTGKSFDSSQYTYSNVEWEKVMQPGDIIFQNGHAEFFIGLNMTGKDVDIPVNLTKIEGNTVIKAGRGAWLSANSDGTLNGLKKGYMNTDTKMYVCRPVYNMK